MITASTKHTEAYAKKQLLHYINQILPKKIFTKEHKYREAYAKGMFPRKKKVHTPVIFTRKMPTLSQRKFRQRKKEKLKENLLKLKRGDTVKLDAKRERLENSVGKYKALSDKYFKGDGTPKSRAYGRVEKKAMAARGNYRRAITLLQKFADDYGPRVHDYKKRTKKRKVNIPEWRNVYNEYIESPEWKCFANACKQSRGKKCEACGSTRHITAHHLSYENFGNESPEDIKILCWPCHCAVHREDTTLSYRNFIQPESFPRT